VTEACCKAHIGRGTFYYWKPRFDEKGYAGLEAFERRGPKEPHWMSPDVEQKVIAVRRKHPAWGKKRIAHELAKVNNWVPLVSPNTVKRILQDADLWNIEETGAGEKSELNPLAEAANRLGRQLMRTCALCLPPMR
jgi:transposase